MKNKIKIKEDEEIKEDFAEIYFCLEINKVREYLLSKKCTYPEKYKTKFLKILYERKKREKELSKMKNKTFLIFIKPFKIRAKTTKQAKYILDCEYLDNKIKLESIKELSKNEK